MTALITGATGFVGSHLIDELLARGTSVRVLVRDATRAEELRQRGLDVRVGDIREPGLMNVVVQDVDVVYHCAAVGSRHSRQAIYETNLTGALNLLHALHQVDRGRVVLLSSIDVLGNKNLAAATEDMPWRPSGEPVADVQIEIEKLVLDYQQRQGVDVVVLRSGYIYGPRDPHHLPWLMRGLRDGTFSFIGSKDNAVPIVHVADVVQAMLLAGDNPDAAGRTYHVANGTKTTVGQFVGHLAEVMGAAEPRRVRSIWQARAAYALRALIDHWGHGRRANREAVRFLGLSRHINIDRARNELGFQPRFNHVDGLADCVRWFQQHSCGAGHAVSLAR